MEEIIVGDAKSGGYGFLAVGPQRCGLEKGPGGTLKHSHESLVVTRDCVFGTSKTTRTSPVRLRSTSPWDLEGFLLLWLVFRLEVSFMVDIYGRT